jgi:hypothetical protein
MVINMTFGLGALRAVTFCRVAPAFWPTAAATKIATTKIVVTEFEAKA